MCKFIDKNFPLIPTDVHPGNSKMIPCVNEHILSDGKLLWDELSSFKSPKSQHEGGSFWLIVGLSNFSLIWVNTDKLREKKFYFLKISFLDQDKVILCNIKSSSISHEMVRRKGEIFNFALTANSTGYLRGLYCVIFFFQSRADMELPSFPT